MSKSFFRVTANADYQLRTKLSYKKNFSDVSKAGQPIKEADVTTLYFTAENASGTLLFAKTSASASQIDWVDSDLGKIKVFVDAADTKGKAASGNKWELKALLATGKYLHLKSGTFDIDDGTVSLP